MRPGRGAGSVRGMLFGKEHTRKYRETGGETGHDWQGTQTLLLTTTGRKSGELRELPLIYAPWEDAYLIVASNGGKDAPPAWYVNLREDPTSRCRSGPTASRPRPATPRPRRRPRCGRR